MAAYKILLCLGGVFFSISIGMPTGIAALIVTIQPVLTNALSVTEKKEKVSVEILVFHHQRN